MEITLENTFKDYEHFCGHLVREVFLSNLFIKELESIEEIDHESDILRRIFVKTQEGDYTIRLWNVSDDDDNVYVEYTIYPDSEKNFSEIL